MSWGIGSTWWEPYSWFVNVMIHEFGHIIGLNDINDLGAPATPCSSHGAARSVMSGCGTPPEGTRHPLSWDKDCATAFNPDARIVYTRRGYTASGTPAELAWSPVYSRRDGLSFGWMESGYNARYAFYHESSLIGDSAWGGDGYFSLYQYWMNSSHLVDLGYLDVVPALFQARESLLSTSEGMRISFVDDENDSDPSIKYNPPYAQIVRTDGIFSGTAGADYTYRVCATTGSCSSYSDILSHLPVIGVWDPSSQSTVHAWVQTSSLDKEDGDGTIFISGGIYNTSPRYLRAALNLSANVTFPYLWSDWDFAGRTDVPPAIACAELSWNEPAGGYNCVIAWTDKGLASSNGDTVLYKFFKVQADGSIALAPGTALLRSSSRTAASPALGFFAGKLWLAFKDLGSTPQSIRVYNSSSAGTWALIDNIPALNAAGSPMFADHNLYEGMVTWAGSL